MGLDMYAYKVKKSLVGRKQFDVVLEKKLGFPASPPKGSSNELRNSWHA
jgi:hypothetical protein